MPIEGEDPTASGQPDQVDAAAPSSALSGVGLAPRFLRSFHWPVEPPPPVSPLLTSSFIAAPLPRPPLAATRDPLAASSLVDFPHLFPISTPVNVDAFERELQGHPNPTWASSLILGLREGFWPCHDGEATEPLRPLTLEDMYPSREADLVVQIANAQKQVLEGLISPAISFVPDGGIVSPQFIVRRGDKARVVDDHTVSGLNTGIGYAPATYDRVDHLVGALRHLGLLDSSLPGAVLFKLDVTNAFKLLPMHPLWQLKQIMAVPYPRAPGSSDRVVRYHVQHQAAFGSRASPCLWTSFMAGVHFVIAKRVPSVPRPLSYMDDEFNVDTSGDLVPHGRVGILRQLPAAQAAILREWDYLGVPWDWRKVGFGRVLEITGLVINLDEATVELPPAAVERFADEVDAFLAEPSRRHPLRKWQQLVGYATWALTTRPWARPLLAPVYAKLSNRDGSPRPRDPQLQVYLNKRVRIALLTFVADLATGEPLNLRDPSLSEWSLPHADLIIHTDACLDCDDGGGSGLGFWFDRDGKRCLFYSRPGIRFQKIVFAEALTVAYAIRYAVALTPTPKRILVRTDSSPSVYMFNTGSAKDREFLPVENLILRTFRLIRLARVDIRLHHIRGAANHTADELSRAPARALRRKYGGLLTSFDPPADLVGRAPL